MRAFLASKITCLHYFTNTPEGACERRLCQIELAINLVDKRVSGDDIEIQFNGKLTEVQINAAENMISYDNGILCAATGFGKTVLAAFLMMF